MRSVALILWLVVCVFLTLRRPFFGAVAIMIHAILKDVLIVETYGFFNDVHFYEVLYITTVVGVLATRGDRLGEFAPRGWVDWGIVGFFLAMLLSAGVNGVSVWDHKYIDLYFKAMVLYFLLSRLTDTPQRMVITAVALVAATSHLMFLAWEKVHVGSLVYARPYWFSAQHDFGLQLVITLPLVGALIAARLEEQVRVAAAALLLVFFAFTWDSVSLASYRPALIGVLVCTLLAAAVATGQFRSVVRLALFVLIPFFVLVSLRCMSRSAYLGAGLGLAMLAWYYRRKVVVLVLAAPLVLFAVYHQTERVSARLESVWTHKLPTGEVDTSIDMRKEQMRTAMRILGANPIFGIGPRQFFLRYREWVSDEDFRGWSYTMHSVPLLILTEEGALGFIMFYGFIVLGALRDARRAVALAREAPELTDVAVVGAGAFMGFLAWAAFSLGQPAMWTINIYGTVALISAARRVTEATSVIFDDVPAPAEVEAPGLALRPAATEVLFP
ncbi:MAG TPA: O-antigen ligase family protein [Planctomycetota bacterium]|nr:O-antigen ligase family protein [Planctomycetota bacterium]HRR78847.1 O-antigen ligase family protein [Planctomycetota bacterium]HRT92847.1 O-antigen ligase family protein [Planctomycetota bacterium]